MEKTVLYTVIFDNYDSVPPLYPGLVSGVDCFLITDDPDLDIPVEYAWKKKVVPREDDPHRHQRRLKLRFHDTFPEYDTVVYMDANLHLTHALKHVMALHKGGMTTGTHPNRRCVYQEGIACEKLNKAPIGLIREQMEAYRKEGIPENLGMFATSFIIRDNTEEVRRFCEDWFDELSRYTHRDQLSIMPVSYRRRFRINGLPSPTVTRFTRLIKHASGGAKYCRIHYLTPYAPDGNIGRAYNEACENVPGRDDWIVLRDGDTLFTTPNWGRHIQHVLDTHKDTYQLYGALTNRIKSKHQQVPGMFDEMSLKAHVQKGMEMERERYGQVCDGGSGVAGFFMAFRRSTWHQTPFREKEKTFDTLFSKDVRRAGGKIGIMNGLYILHLYRMWSDNPFNDAAHLDIVGR